MYNVKPILFTKMQGVGNDFIVVDGRGQNARDWTALAVMLCGRHKGVGADGLLILQEAANADFAMQMFNPDGSPDVCGNGLRCIARYASENGIVTGDTLRIFTFAGVHEAHLVRDGLARVEAVRVGMGLPRLAPADIPMLADTDSVIHHPLRLQDGSILPITALSTGSAHAVTFVNSLPDDADFLRISPQVEHHPAFPERVSLMWCVSEGLNRLRMRIWERGAGETWGCGTGACAAGVAAVLQGLAQAAQPINVASKGGSLTIRWQQGGPIEMTGPARVVYQGEYTPDFEAAPNHITV